MKYDRASEVVDALGDILRSLGIKESYARLVPAGNLSYDVSVVIHPDESDLVSKLPSWVSTSPWTEEVSESSPYVKKTPRTPLKKTDPMDFYPSWAKRRVDGPMHSPDINPAGSGLRRIPDLQDLVKVSAMRNSIKDRLSRVARVIRVASRMSLAAGIGRGRESEYLVSEVLDQLSSEGFNGRHKIVRLVKALKTAMKDAGYTFQGDV